MPADQYGTTESNMDHALMKSWVYPALKPEQKVMIVRRKKRERLERLGLGRRRSREA